MGRKKSRFYKGVVATESGAVVPLEHDPLLNNNSKSKKREREFEKYVSKKLKKEERPALFSKLQELSFTSDKLHSSKNLGLVRKSIEKTGKPLPAQVEDSSHLKNTGPSSYEQLHGKNPLKIFSVIEKKASLTLQDESEDELTVEYKNIENNEPVIEGGAESTKKSSQAFFVLVDRPEEIERQRVLLPIYAEEQKIMESIKENPVTIICGETGSGKTTQVPQFLFEAGFGHPDSENPGIVAVTQPRRVAAISMANRVAFELSDAGKEGFVAHQIRFDSTASEKTRIKFLTDGILLREISTDFLLTKYSVIILDEAHERNLNTDILIGMLSRIVRLRRDLKLKGEAKPLRLVVMSATLDTSEFVRPHLFDPLPPIIKVEARQHPVSVHFARRTNPDHVEAAFKTISKIHSNLPPGGILVFLTGKQEIVELTRNLEAKYPLNALIRKKGKAGNDLEGLDENGDGFQCEKIRERPEEETISDGEDEDVDFDCSDFELECQTNNPLYVLPLHSLLPPEQQQRVFEAPPEGTRLCVLATNVAETSITIPGIKYVVDSGKVKQREYNLDTGSQSYQVVWCSKASASQRAGRAGRTGPGHCYRLYSSAVFDQQFPDYAQPEIKRVPIESLVLQLKSMGIDNPKNFPLPSQPDMDAVEQAEKLLCQLKALSLQSVSGTLKITKLGSLMSSIPLAPRWSKLLILACQDFLDDQIKLDELSLVIAMVSIISVGDPFFESHGVQTTQFGKKNILKTLPKPASSDIFVWLQAVLSYSSLQPANRLAFANENGLMQKKLDESLLQFNQIRNLLGQLFTNIEDFGSLPSSVTRKSIPYLRQSLSDALPDRIAERTKVVGEKSSQPAYRLLKKVHGDAPSESTDMVLYLHSSSCLSGCPPRFIVFNESITTEKKTLLKIATAIEQSWIPSELLLA